MKMLIMALLLVVVADVAATEMDSKSSAERYVADDVEIQKLPTGGVFSRLVSKSKRTVKQYWSDSQYSRRVPVSAFPIYDETVRSHSGSHGVGTSERKVSQNYQMHNDRFQSLNRALECK